MRTSRSMTRALHTFFRTSLSSSPASANRLWPRGREKRKRWGSLTRLNNQKDLYLNDEEGLRGKGRADGPTQVSDMVGTEM